jgi:homoserine O-acetyltransferase/O-succinyltransferase
VSALTLVRGDSATRSSDCSVPLTKPFQLESGDVIADTCLQVSRFGPLDAPQVVVLGGISSGRRVGGQGGWWADVVAPRAGVDLERYGVIGLDFAPLGDQRVRITPHDQARLLALALDGIGVGRLRALVGASYGGMVGVAFAALAPERLERLCVISASHRPSAQALAWRGVQRRIVEFGLSHGDGASGLALARQLAMITYRSPKEFEARFGSGVDNEGRGEVDRYLIARGGAYVDVVTPKRWLSLSEAIDRCSVDPAAVATPTTLVACPSDQLVPIGDIEELARRLPRLRAFHALPSLHGHDAFLKEATNLAPILQTFLESSQ